MRAFLNAEAVAPPEHFRRLAGDRLQRRALALVMGFHLPGARSPLQVARCTIARNDCENAPILLKAHMPRVA